MSAWHWPQWTILSFFGFALLYSMFLHEKPRTGRHNWFAGAFMLAVETWVLWMGGFFG
jgi:hypothetical protein